MVQRRSRPSKIGPINLGTKQAGAPSAGNPHAGCDVAGAGNGFTVWLMRHSQRKRGAMARLDLRNTAPVLDPTPWVPESTRSYSRRLVHWPKRGCGSCELDLIPVSRRRVAVEVRQLAPYPGDYLQVTTVGTLDERHRIYGC